MKLKFKIAENRKSNGIALVLTLILLSVTLIMAVAFLFMSRREQGSVTTQTDQATARYAADAALADAQAQIAANILAGAQANPYNYGLLVSTNFININGWAPGFTNVNYDYDTNGNALTTAEFLQNLTNLLYRPRPPVFIPQNGTNDFRFYLDLNRNGRFDPNGMVPDVVTNSSGNLQTNNNNDFEVGDPEWIGILERPDEPYGPNNHFVARYAYIAIPIGNTLDLNAIHNQSLIPPQNLATAPMNMNNDAYFRNQGVGSWEINLAAFLTDLNTNQWDNTTSGQYFYTRATNSLIANSGAAFNDAFSLLAYRYATNYNTLATAGALFQNTQNYPSNVDVYADGGLQMTVDTNYSYSTFTADNLNFSFAGANNTNHFFDLSSELFDPTKSSPQFVQRLSNAGTGGATYDRYTFYRLLAQMGTDSQPESDKMDLNYDNLDASGNVIAGAETNFVPWTNSIKFFTNAADRLLRAYTAQWATVYTNDEFGIARAGVNTNFVNTFQVTNAFGIGNIPVWVSNRFVYTPAVNRLLQLAANIYDATRTNFYPHIFRPMFTHDLNGNIFIAGYAEDINTNIIQGDELNVVDNPDLATPIEFYDFTNLVPANTVVLTNIYGVPWIVGAKKGLPNFNELASESAFQMTRKLEGVRDWTASPQPKINWTNQMYLMTLTNYLGLEFWNSYHSNYLGAGNVNPGVVDVAVRSYLYMALTNISETNMPSPYMPVYYHSATNWFIIETNLWHGWNGGGSPQPGLPSSFITWTTNINFFSDVATYVYSQPYGPGFVLNDTNENYLDLGVPNLPHLLLFSTNRLQAAIIDYSAGLNHGRVIDYVQLGGLDGVRDLNSEIKANDKDGMFNTNYDAQGIPQGVYQQIYMSEYGTLVGGGTPAGPGRWSTAQVPGGTSQTAEQEFFRAFLNSPDGKYDGGLYQVSPTNTNVQAPYTPTVLGVQYQTWQANDPLVHYLASDLTSLANGQGLKQTIGWPENIGVVNNRYRPWGIAPTATGSDLNPFNLSYKDPLVWQSDDWDFPANVLPTVGWLGRVHRGTPWQSIYLKATNILTWANSTGGSGTTTWLDWTGDGNLFDATNMAPTQDRLLFDLFTTGINDNATRGRLSVNTAAGNLAVWSAVFSGMTVLTNNAYTSRPHHQNPLPGQYGPLFTNLFINPAGPDTGDSPVWQLMTNIDATRRAVQNPDGVNGAFEHKGDILAAAKLSDQSPFLNTTNSMAQLTNNISDEMYEWLPQQAMSLLSVGNHQTRYVIYTWGQCLQPAPGGTYLGSDYFGMVTNYQVTAEVGTREVIRVTPTNSVIESFNILPPQ